MKKIAFSIIALSTLFALETKAQHAEGHEVTKIPPKVLFTREITSMPEIQGQEAQLVLVRFAPGEKSGPHRHPLALVGYVLEGSIESTFEGETHVFKQGDTFWEEPHGLHNGTQNLSNTKEAKLLVWFVGPKGTPILVPEKK